MYTHNETSLSQGKLIRKKESASPGKWKEIEKNTKKII